MNQFTKIIAAQLKLKEQAVENTLALLEEGCTIPFISRYRKEKTGNMDEVSIEAIAQANEKLKEMAKRKETILKTIDEQGKLTDALKKRIEDCWDATELEDIYLPYKPKRRTRAQIAREQGLEPLAQILLLQRERNIMQAAKKFVGDKVADVDAAIQGAKDIIAETVSENEESRNAIRGEFRRGAIITSKVVAKKKDEEEAQRFSDYFDFSEPLKRCSSHRLLAMRRGEAAPEKAANVLAKTNFAFLFAQVYHSAMRFAAPVRKALGVRTIMNLIGPLTNPADAKYLMLGAYDKNLLSPMAEAAKMLGAKHVLVVSSADGFDEISPSVPTYVHEIDEENQSYEYVIEPSTFGIPPVDDEDLGGGTGEENARTALELANGKGKPALRYAVALNAGAALYTARRAKSLKEGFETALAALDSGAVLRKIEEVKRATAE